MWPFKKKKIYKVEYKDQWYDYGCCIVKAKDKERAWKAARRQTFGYYKATVYINITELKDA